MKNKNRYFLSEFIGSCFLVMIIVGSGLMAENLTDDTAVMLIANTLATGAGLFVLITVFADVSGAHFNPAVSIAFAYAKKFSWKEVPKYIFFQVAGAFAASLLLMWLFPKSELLGATIPTVDVWRGFVLELILTFFLMVVIINVSTGSKEVGMMAGIAIGSVVLLEALFAGPITNASMNPARSLAPNIDSGNIKGLWLYILAPIIGALLAVVSCKFVKHENCCDEEC